MTVRLIYVIFLLGIFKFVMSQLQPFERTLTNEKLTKNWCEFEIDAYSCLNINCNYVKRLKIMPESIFELSRNFSMENFRSHNDQNSKSLLLCSMDLSDTGMTQLQSETFKNFDLLLLETIRLNPNQSHTNIKLFMSNLNEIRELGMPNYLNTVLFIRDSAIHYIQPKVLGRSGKLELNLISKEFFS